MSADDAPQPSGPWTERPDLSIPLAEGPALDAGDRPLVMGIVNATPDSFSDGGEYYAHEAAVKRGLELERQGADIIDIGGESTRPGSTPVDPGDEKDRVVSVVQELAPDMDAPISIDTRKSAVAEAALDAGAAIVNDVSALRHDPDMASLVAERDVPVCLMHMQGTPQDMQDNPTYGEVVADVRGWLDRRVEVAAAAGIDEHRIMVDPGFGFGKTAAHNLELLRRLHEFHELGRTLLVGTSRKSMIGAVLDVPTGERLHGTLSTLCCAVMSGAHILRVHDVGPALQAVRMCEAVRRGANWSPQTEPGDNT
jgi:dihydropteroate synthase